ncbi:MAG: 3,4-dihydroxy-2-butanone-4-phosphate synthase [Deltaproteobacteria bacterium]|nr:3,4-dihydroxy-2-butanone-4-phosphate synthase [Deltaproteobacteria bacterium]
MKYPFDSIEEAIEEIRKGNLVIIMDSKEREYEGDFVGAAAKMTTAQINFMLSYARGAFIAVFMPPGWADQLEIPRIAKENTSFNQTKFLLSVDAKNNVSGSSAFDRAMTVNLLGDSNAKPSDFVRPGHVVPIEADPKGFSARKGHTESGVELMKLAGIEPPVAIDLEILDEDGTMAHEERLFALAKEFNLKIISVDDLVKYVIQRQREKERPIPSQARSAQRL